MNTHNHVHVESSLPNWRQQLAPNLFAFLPFTLFFPVGSMYAIFVFFLIALLIGGDFKKKWHSIIQSPLLLPIVLLSAVSIVIAAIHHRDEHEFLTGFLHYQTYWFLLVLTTVGTGAWQRKAVYFFFLGAVLAASIFYLNALEVLPQWKHLRSYQIYEGNKSILIGLLLAIASVWMMHDWLTNKNKHVIRAFFLFYIVIALLCFANTRTAILLFFILTGVMVLRKVRFGWKLFAGLFILFLMLVGGVRYISELDTPITCETKNMRTKYQMQGLDVLKNRLICTVHQVRDFNKTQSISTDGMRLELFKNTLEMGLESPILGHGIGNWLGFYKEKAKGSLSEEMTTPHNDYLLYFFELGIFGLFALLIIWCKQLFIAKKMSMNQRHQPFAMPLLLMTVSIMFAALFNAILRDGLFSLAMMILLAIPLAGVTKQSLNKQV